MLCSKCGANLPDSSQFCLKCGQAVNATANSAASATAPATVLCSKCGTDLPDGSQFCLQCGQTVKAAPAPGAGEPATQTRARPKPRIAIWFLLLALPLMVWWAATSDNPGAQLLQRLVDRSHTETITPPALSVKSHSFSSYKFTIPPAATNVVVRGQFSATGGPDNEVEVYVLTDAAFVNWQYGYSPSTYYSSGRVAQGDINAALPSGAGTYYLVFNNNFSLRKAKAVQAVVTLSYQRWWPTI